jgi:hypothetical protein
MDAGTGKQRQRHRAHSRPAGPAGGAVHSRQPLPGRPDTGATTLPNGDGLLREGRTLYAVQNQQNAIDVLHLDRQGTRAELITRITDPRFDVCTTVASFGNRLYLPNARFSTPSTPDTAYTAVAVGKP